MSFFVLHGKAKFLNFIAADNSGGGRKAKSHRDFAAAKPQSKEPQEQSLRSDARRLCDRRGTSNLSFFLMHSKAFFIFLLYNL